MICRRRATRSASSRVASSGSGADLRLGRLDEAGDHRGIDRIGLGALAERLGEGADLRRIDHHHRQAGRRQRLAATTVSKPPVASTATIAAPAAAGASTNCVQAGRIALDRKRLTARPHSTSSRSFDTSIPTMMPSIVTPPCLIGLRLAAQATVRVRWNDGRGASSPTVFKTQGLSVSRPSPRPLSYPSRGMRVTRG